MEQENFSDCEPLRQKKLNDVSSPPTYKRTTLLRIKQAYSIKKEFLQKSLAEITGRA